MTGTDGTASVHWTLGTQVGINDLSAITGALTPVLFAATGAAGPLANIAVANRQTAVEAGDLVQPDAQATDSYGNAVPLPFTHWMVVAGKESEKKRNEARQLAMRVDF